MSTERNISSEGTLPFRRLTARSVLLSVLLGTDEMWLPTPLLLSTTALFGIAEGTARTALSRMSAVGEIEAINAGYRIVSTDLQARSARQLSGRSGTTATWNGEWRQVIVGLGVRRSAAERAGVRSALHASRYGELREGVWLRPNNISAPDIAELGEDTISAVLTDLNTAPGPLAATLWDLDSWADGARELIAFMSPLADRLVGDDASALADGFVINAAVLRQLAADPLLPDELLPATWPGGELRAAFDRFDDAFRRVILAHFDRHRHDSNP